jgi:hypothetical protein
MEAAVNITYVMFSTAYRKKIEASVDTFCAPTLIGCSPLLRERKFRHQFILLIPQFLLGILLC